MSALTSAGKPCSRLGFARYIRLFQLLRLGWGQHAKCSAYFHIHLAYFADHFKDTLETTLPARQVPPRGAHAESGAAILLRLACSL